MPISSTSATSSATGAGFALWLIVPVKPFGEGKSRLAAALPSSLRAELSQRWLTHVLTTAGEWGAAPHVHLAGMAVISRDPAVLALANDSGARPILEARPGLGEGDDLNSALTQASGVASNAGAEGILVLPSDLPLLTREDLDSLYELAREGHGVVISPSHDGGTNALLLRPPQAIPYAFGVDSFAHHMLLATAAGLDCRIYRSATLALDIDRPEDLLLAKL